MIQLLQRKASKSSIRNILGRYADGHTNLTMEQFKVLLDELCKKKPQWDPNTRTHTQEESKHVFDIVLPLYADMMRTGQAPKRDLVTLALGELNKPFRGFRKKSEAAPQREKFPVKQPVDNLIAQSATKAAPQASKAAAPKATAKPKRQPKVQTEAELRKKLHDEWSQKNSHQGCRLDHIKSIGNGL